MATLNAYKIDYKVSPKSRKTISVVQFHPSPEVASEMKLIRDFDPEAVLVGVRLCTADELDSIKGGTNPF